MGFVGKLTQFEIVTFHKEIERLRKREREICTNADRKSTRLNSSHRP